MSNFPTFVKNNLLSHVQDLGDFSWLFVKNPGKDFTLNRKLLFETVIEILISMGGGSFNGELHEFTHSFLGNENYKGYRLLAVDGTDLNLFHNPNYPDSYYQSTPN